jgi:hypothetical protein
MPVGLAHQPDHVSARRAAARIRAPPRRSSASVLPRSATPGWTRPPSMCTRQASAARQRPRLAVSASVGDHPRARIDRSAPRHPAYAAPPARTLSLRSPARSVGAPRRLLTRPRLDSRDGATAPLRAESARRSRAETTLVESLWYKRPLAHAVCLQHDRTRGLVRCTAEHGELVSARCGRLGTV